MKWSKRGTTYTADGAIITKVAAFAWQLRIAYPDGRIEYIEKPTLQAAKHTAERLLREDRMRHGE